MVAVADDSADRPVRVGPPAMGCDQVNELIAQGTLPPDTPALNACEPHGGGGGRRK